MDRGDYVGLCSHREAAPANLPLLDVCLPEWQFLAGLERLLKRVPRGPAPPKQQPRSTWRHTTTPKVISDPTPPPPPRLQHQTTTTTPPATMAYVIQSPAQPTFVAHPPVQGMPAPPTTATMPMSYRQVLVP